MIHTKNPYIKGSVSSRNLFPVLELHAESWDDCNLNASVSQADQIEAVECGMEDG